MYRNGTRWRKQYLLVKDASGCFMLFDFLPVVLKSGSFRGWGRFSAKWSRLLRLRAFSSLLPMNGLFVFFSTAGRKSSVNFGDWGVQLVGRDSIPFRIELHFGSMGGLTSIGTL